jgi:hypothetical protein
MPRFRARRTSARIDHESVSYSSAGPWHLAGWIWPWVVTAALWPLAAVLWLIWGSDPVIAPWAAVAVALATVGLSAWAWKLGRARGSIVRGHGTAAVAVAGGWLLIAVLDAPWTRPARDFYVLLILLWPATWNIRRGMRAGDEGDSGWSDLASKIKLPGSRVIDVGRDGYRTTATVEVTPGLQTAADVDAARPHIASALRVPLQNVRSVADPDDAARAKLTVVSVDVLRTPTPWPGPSARGTSIAEVAVIGPRENGDQLRLWFPGDPHMGRAAMSLLITGMTGAGKSAGGRLLIAEILTRWDVELTLIDTVKGVQFNRPFRDHPRIRQLATTHADAKKAIAALPERIRLRANELGERGYDEWEPGCGLPYEVVHIEEAADSVATSRDLVRAAQTCRSAGMSLIVSLQRAMHTNLPTDVRQQLGGTLAFGCKAGDQKFTGLSEEALAAGAAPQEWGNSRPGYCYLTGPGIDADLWGVPGRTFHTDAPTISQAVAEPDAAEPTLTLVPPLAEPEPSRPDARQAQSLVIARLKELREAGVAEIKPSDFADLGLDRSPAWYTAALSQLVGDGVLRPIRRGVYGWAA